MDVHDWVVRVKGVAQYHTSQLKDNSKWTLRDTARELRRSVGRVSEDLMLVSFMRTHPKVETYKRIQDAVAYCRRIKREQRMRV